MHFRLVCQYGKPHGQCRCWSMDKTTKQMDCPTPDVCGAYYRPKHARLDVLPEHHDGKYTRFYAARHRKDNAVG